MSRETGLQHFVRGLLGGGAAHRRADRYLTADGREADAPAVLALIASGALAGNESDCRATAETRAWLKRSRLNADAFAAQHRIITATPDGNALNLAESPLARLASGDAAFLSRHHLETGERVRRLVERAQLLPRVTMSYSADRTAGGPQHKNDISDMAADARRAVAQIHALLPRDCASVVIDVCGFLKGLQEVERAHNWPRRSAKLVLRIGLEQLAQHYGIGSAAIGPAHSAPTGWMEPDARPTRLDLR
jgi:hypothetical protein